MKLYIQILAVSILLASCVGKVKYSIDGDIEGLGDGTVYMKDYIDGTVIDSAELHGGKFRFEGDIEEPTAVNLCKGAGQSFAFMILESGKAILEGSFGGDRVLSAEGTPANDAIMRRHKFNAGMLERFNSGNLSDEESAALLDTLRRISVESDMKANIGNLYGVILFRTLVEQDLLSEEQADEYRARFPEKLRNSRLMKSIYETKGRNPEANVVRAKYIDIAQPNVDGDTVRLSSVVDDPANRYVLLDFWASWCGPCMGEVPHLKAAYGKFREHGLEIYAVTCDRDRDEWKKAIEANGMEWIHVGVLDRKANTAVDDYAVTSIPMNFLIDCTDGRIIASDLRGEKLEEELEKLLGN